MIADVVLVGLLERGTAAPSPVRRDRWVAHVGYVPSETPLPEHLATYTDQTTTSTTSATSAPRGTSIRDEIGAAMDRLALASMLPTNEETQTAVDKMIAESRAARGATGATTRVIKRRTR